jgi:hypothetical protein
MGRRGGNVNGKYHQGKPGLAAQHTAKLSGQSFISSLVNEAVCPVCRHSQESGLE